MAKPQDDLLGDFLPDAQALELRAPRPGYRSTLYLLLALLIIAVIWASVAKIDRLVMAQGRLVTTQPNLVVQPLERGILKTIEVRVGQVVRAGTTLATFDPTFASADRRQLESRVETLGWSTRRLVAELAGSRELPPGEDSESRRLQADLLRERSDVLRTRLAQYDKNIERLQASLDTNRADQKALERRVGALKELEQMYTELGENKFSSRAAYLEVQEKRLEIERDYILTHNREQEIEIEIATQRVERQNFHTRWRQDLLEQLTENRQQLEELQDQLTKARRRSDLITMTAQQDAIVLEIGKKSVGSIVQEAEPLFVLVPLDPALEVEVEVDPADVAEIQVDDPVRIKLDAYPFQKYGTVTGRVSHISADTFRDDQSMGGKRYYYLTRANLEDIHLETLDITPTLYPGMTLSAEIITGKRSVMSYFLYPLLRTWKQSLGER